jgi:hypothetical protein
MTTRRKTLLPALVLALVSGAALAQFLYKSTMPDGRVIYGDAPMPNAVKVEKTKPDTSRQGISGATTSEAEALRKLQTERAPGAAAPDRTVELELAIRKMEAEREQFREPREGERIGVVSKGSTNTRFTDGYLERQKKYDDDLEALRRELAKARAGQ